MSKAVLLNNKIHMETMTMVLMGMRFLNMMPNRVMTRITETA